MNGEQDTAEQLHFHKRRHTHTFVYACMSIFFDSRGELQICWCGVGGQLSGGGMPSIFAFRPRGTAVLGAHRIFVGAPFEL